MTDMSWKVVVGWVAAVVVTTFLTWQIVSVADSRVGGAPLAVAPTATPTSTTEPTTTTSPPATSTSTSSATSTSSTVTPSPPTTATSAPTSSTPASWSVRTINSSGGTVVVRYRPGEVELQAATPAPGFDVEVDDAGPPRVRVEFESDGSESSVEVEWKDGALDVEVDGGS